LGEGQSQGSQILVIPQADHVLNQFKYEIAQELGIEMPCNGYMGHMTARDTGAIGGHMTRKLIEIAQHQLSPSPESDSSHQS
jgi:hypothetical protein